MEERYFEWESFLKNQNMAQNIVSSLEEVFLLDRQKRTVRLSPKLAKLISPDENPLPPVITIDQLESCFQEDSANSLRQEGQRLLDGKTTKRASCHVSVRAHDGELSSVLYMFPVVDGVQLLGFLSVDYEPMREYNKSLEDVIKELEHVRMVNELTLEGASDYVYQLDIVNNICTFSSNSLEKLPLDSPTFPDAMNRVLSFIVPEDRQVFLDSFVPFLTGQSDFHVAQYRVLTKQGDIMWISCKGKGIHDEEGRPLMIAGSLMDITQQKLHEEEIRHMLYNDLLTGLGNRRSFEMDVTERLEKQGKHGSVLFIDIRRFKLFNELFGHEFGNRVLQEFAYMLKLYFPNALGIYRFSGDEFLVHLRECTHKEIMEKLTPFCANLKRPREIDDHTFYINAYVGIVIYPEHGNSADQLLKNLNQCMYRLDRDGKEDIAFFANDMSDSLSMQFMLENELRKDIEHGYRHFRVVYQPIVRLTPDGSYWIGAEALLRYSNPNFPKLDQMELIHTLEYTGLIQAVGRWVISMAVHECSCWNRSGCPAIVHVNVAAQQVADARLVKYIEDCCRQEGLAPGNLVAELTETSLVDNSEMAVHLCENLKKLGVGVALDDFGTGYSSFNYLRTLPISEIKVDCGYTQKIAENSYNRIIVNFLQHLSESLNLQLCVEGVETVAELELIRDMGITMIQGFFFEKPLEANVMRREFPNRGMKVEG